MANKAVGVATANFRQVARELTPGRGFALVPQQLYLITEEPGSTKERTYHAWLDVDCDLFKAAETDRERGQRHRVESFGKEFVIRKA